VDSRETFQKLSEFATLYAASALKRLEHYQGDRPLFDVYHVEHEIE
jgi:ribonuclease G